jgi:hypothetical protein
VISMLLGLVVACWTRLLTEIYLKLSYMQEEGGVKGGRRRVAVKAFRIGSALPRDSSLYRRV